MDRKIVILGGTFNPIHNGHVLASHALIDSKQFDEVWIMPSGNPPYKQEEQQSVDDRFHMVKQITDLLPELIYREDERNQELPSYTYDTLESLRESYPSTQFYWTIGYDNLISIEQWKDGAKLLSTYGLVLLNRGGYSREYAKEKAHDIRENYGCPILEIDMPAVDISSTDIRRRVSEGQSIIGYCPECIIDYIYKKGLYQTFKG